MQEKQKIQKYYFEKLFLKKLKIIKRSKYIQTRCRLFEKGFFDSNEIKIFLRFKVNRKEDRDKRSDYNKEEQNFKNSKTFKKDSYMLVIINV